MTDKTDALVAALQAAVDWAMPMEDAPKDSRPEWFDKAREALAAPAEGGQGEYQHEWRSGDNAIVQRAVFCIHCHEIRTAKAAGSHEPMIDSAGGAKGYEGTYATPERLAKPAAAEGCDFCGVRPGEFHAYDCTALDETPQPAEGDGAVGFVKQADLDALARSKDEETAIGLFARRSAGDSYTQPIFATRPAAAAVVPDEAMVTLPAHCMENVLTAAALLEASDSIIDRREGDTLRKIAALAAPKGGVVDEAWRQQAAEWLEAKAAEQEANNQRWPDHAAAYGSWRDRPGVLRLLATEVRAALANQEQRHDALADGEAVSR